MAYLMGIDSGLSVTKAVIFNTEGQVLSLARCRIPQLIPAPHHVERDMKVLWSSTAQVVKQALATSAISANEIAVISVTAHGDGLYLLDRHQAPLGMGILSLDTRAESIARNWLNTDVGMESLQLTGQLPHASAPSSLLAWIKIHDRERYSKIGTLLSCKDWLRFCLCGTLGTDLTEASTSFTNVLTQDYSEDILNCFELNEIHDALPLISESTTVVGQVTAQAAKMTGLLAGTPVVAGLHDVTASSIGVGGHKKGSATLVAGTYSINETLVDSPKIDPHWYCRNSIQKGLWNCMSISPASATNYDWFIDTFCTAEKNNAQDIHKQLGALLREGLQQSSIPLFHPFLFGSPHTGASSGSLLGLHGWHDRPAILRSVIEGIAFNHRWHVEALATGFTLDHLHLTGGISRNSDIAQMFANILGLPLQVSSAEEPAAWGAALCGAAGLGLIDSALNLSSQQTDQAHIFVPQGAYTELYDKRYEIFNEATERLAPIWEALENCAMPQELLAKNVTH